MNIGLTERYHSNGRIDIRIIAKNDFEIDDAYYTIECKRLDNQNLLGETGLNAKYVKEGIKRFTIDHIQLIIKWYDWVCNFSIF